MAGSRTLHVEQTPGTSATGMPAARCRESVNVAGFRRSNRSGGRPVCELFRGARGRSRTALFELELLDAVADLVPVQPQKGRGARLIPAGALERLDDEGPFELFEVHAASRQLDPIA